MSPTVDRAAIDRFIVSSSLFGTSRIDVKISGVNPGPNGILAPQPAGVKRCASAWGSFCVWECGSLAGVKTARVCELAYSGKRPARVLGFSEVWHAACVCHCEPKSSQGMPFLSTNRHPGGASAYGGGNRGRGVWGRAGRWLSPRRRGLKETARTLSLLGNTSTTRSCVWIIESMDRIGALNRWNGWSY